MCEQKVKLVDLLKKIKLINIIKYKETIIFNQYQPVNISILINKL